MPGSAVRLGCVDVVLPLARVAGACMTHAKPDAEADAKVSGGHA